MTTRCRLDEITVDPGLVPLAFAADALKHGAQILEECQVVFGVSVGECDQHVFWGREKGELHSGIN